MIPAQVWSEATIKSNTEACAGHRAIELEVPKETADAFETAGQYVQLTIGEEKPGFYAIASAPGKATFEFVLSSVNCDNKESNVSMVVPLAMGLKKRCVHCFLKRITSHLHARTHTERERASETILFLYNNNGQPNVPHPQ